MEVLSVSEYLWLFLLYSFAGWVLETAAAVIIQKRLVNRGLINGPFCIIYGFTAVMLTIVLQDMDGPALILFSGIYATGVEWISGHLIELIWKERWWNYSGLKWNIGGYVCLPMSVLWGVLGFLTVRFINPFLLTVYADIPEMVMKIAILGVMICLLIDVLADLILLTARNSRMHLTGWVSAKHTFSKISLQLGRGITHFVEERIRKAYPNASRVENKKIKSDIFAEGICFEKLVFLFVIGAFLGDVTETIFMKLTTGTWMSRSSVIWGQFSIVWGLGIVLLTALLHKYKDSQDRYLFYMGTFAGAAFEYLCSVFTELVFGKVFWNYSHIPFNLAGRVNLLFSFFWGIAAVVWFKLLFPRLSAWIEKIPLQAGKAATLILLVFMIANAAASSIALERYQNRADGKEAQNVIETWMDEHYDDARMKAIYPKAVQVQKKA
ncbi:MAG: putative ABC transporter permease [Lachnospiraceae bacterium]|nr:putative ABC transporter permease [Lachnospiraceae bacterium]